jgi:hypothetical protein
MSPEDKLSQGKESTKRKEPIENNEAIKNLLIISLLKDNVEPKVIETATGIPEKTIRNKFPMKDIKKTHENQRKQEKEQSD